MNDTISDEWFPISFLDIPRLSGFSHHELNGLYDMGLVVEKRMLIVFESFDRVRFDTILCRYLRFHNAFLHERHPEWFGEFQEWYYFLQHPEGKQKEDELSQWQQRVKVFIRGFVVESRETAQTFVQLQWLDRELSEYQQHPDEFKTFLAWHKTYRGNSEIWITKGDVLAFYQDLVDWKQAHQDETLDNTE